MTRPTASRGGRRRPNLTADLVDRLTDSIRQGFVRPGEKLPTESAMVDSYGVSRTVVREAISRMQAAGLVETHRGRGSFVLAVPSAGPLEMGFTDVRTLDDAVALVEFRTAVEIEAAALAALRRTERDLADIHDAHERLQASSERPDRTMQADLAFHLAIAAGAHNHYFGQLLRSFGPGLMVMPAARVSDAASTADHLAVVAREHDEIYRAIERGDPDSARAAVRLHLSNTAGRLA